MVLYRGHQVTTRIDGRCVEGIVVDIDDSDPGSWMLVIRTATGRAHHVGAADVAPVTTTEGDEWRQRALRARARVDARTFEMKADLADRDGRHAFRGLFSVQGDLVAALPDLGHHGVSWWLLAYDDPEGPVVGRCVLSTSPMPLRRWEDNAKRGYRLGWVMAPAEIRPCVPFDYRSAGMPRPPVYERTDGGFSRNVSIIDDGSTWYGS